MSTIITGRPIRMQTGMESNGRPMEPHRPAAPAGVAGARRTFLRVKLFYKILIANALILSAVLLVAGYLTHTSRNGDAMMFMVLFGGGLLASVLGNALILRLALMPLQQLQRTAEQVEAGDLAARVPASDLADPDLERLMTTFNTILESGEVYRRRLRDIAARALNATEEERKRIARELHDGTAQTLAALRVRLRVARAAEDAEVRSQLLERIGAELGEATEEIRRIAQGLRPPALDMLGLAPAIDSFARGIGDTTGLDVVTEITPVEDLLAPEAELALYRIVQEALSNVSRHASAERVTIRLGPVGRSVLACIEDDGSGFAVVDEMSNRGLGLFGMQERAAYVGGTVEIESEPGRGTRIRATIPVLETAPYA
jgi:two-component system, NarL family, sensor histidine kinase UhpB